MFSYHWTTEDEQATWVDVVNSVRVQVFGRDDLLDDKFHNVTTDFFQGSLRQMLGRYDDSVNADWYAGSIVEMVFTGNLENRVNSDLNF